MLRRILFLFVYGFSNGAAIWKFISTAKLVYNGISIHLNFSFFKLNLYSGGWNQGPLDTAATNGLLCQPRVIMMMEKSVE
jgi:hypothetical protein